MSANIKKNLDLLRSLQEQILSNLNKKDSQIITGLRSKANGCGCFGKIHNHLSGNVKRNVVNQIGI